LRWLECKNDLGITLYDLESDIDMWSCKLPYSLIKKHKWCTATFTGDIHCPMAADNFNVFKMDIRAPQSFTSYINLHDYDNIIAYTLICDLIPVPNSCRFLTITAEQSIVWDERNVKLPLLSSSHMLRDRPKRSNLVKWKDQHILFLSNQLDQLVSTIGMKHLDSYNETGDKYLKASGLTKNYKFIEPLTDYAHSNDLFFFEDMYRLESKFTGQACFAESNKLNSTFHVLICNQLGDILSRRFFLKENQDVGPIDNDKPSVTKINDKLADWQNFILDMESAKTIEDTVDLCYTDISGRYKKRRKTLTGPRGTGDGEWKLLTLINNYMDSAVYKSIIDFKKNIHFKDILVSDYIDELQAEEYQKFISMREETSDVFSESGKHSESAIMDGSVINTCIDPLSNKILRVFPTKSNIDTTTRKIYHANPCPQSLSLKYGLTEKVQPFQPAEVHVPEVDNTLPLDVTASADLAALEDTTLPDAYHTLTEVISESPFSVSQLFPSQFITPSRQTRENSLNMSLNGSILSHLRTNKKKGPASGF